MAGEFRILSNDRQKEVVMDASVQGRREGEKTTERIDSKEASFIARGDGVVKSALG